MYVRDELLNISHHRIIFLNNHLDKCMVNSSEDTIYISCDRVNAL